MTSERKYLRFGRDGEVVDLVVEVTQQDDGSIRLHSKGTDLPFDISGEDLIAALDGVRLLIEPSGWLVFCNASRRNAVHSGMSRSMSGGFRHYLVRIGKDAPTDGIVDALDAVDINDASEIVTLAEQKMFYERWLKWLPRRTEK